MRDYAKSLDDGNYQVLSGSVIKMKVYELRFDRTNGAPNEYTETIEGPMDTMIFEVINGDENGHRVSSCRIWLNGEEIFSPDEFNQDVSLIEKKIYLPQNTNTLKVRLASSPGSFIRLNVYCTYDVSTGFGNPPKPDTIIDERGDSIILEDPYYPILPDEKRLEELEEINAQPILGQNNINFQLAQRGDIITSGHFWYQVLWVRFYNITHDGLARYSTSNPADPNATIHAHPNANGQSGVKKIFWNFWKGYDCCIIDRVSIATSGQKQNAVAYADAQLNEPYSYATWAFRWYTDKWCCSSLVWRSYFESGIDLFPWWNNEPQSSKLVRSPTPKELMSHPLCVQITASFN